MEERIVRTATELFSKKGFHTTTMRDIAKSAKVSIGAIYHHFRSKDEIFLAIIRREYARLRETAERIHAEEVPVYEFIGRMSQLLFETADEYGKAERVVLRLRFAENPRLRKEVESLRHDLIEYIAGLIEEDIRLGRVRPCDPMITATIVLGMGEALLIPALANDTYTEHYKTQGPQELATMTWHALRAGEDTK